MTKKVNWINKKGDEELVEISDEEYESIRHECAIDPKFKEFWYELQGCDWKGEDYEIVKYGIGGMAPQSILI